MDANERESKPLIASDLGMRVRSTWGTAAAVLRVTADDARGFFVKRLAHFAALGCVLLFASCATKDTDHVIRVSVADQRMAVYDRGAEIARYDVSTSKFGLGDRPGSRATPLGRLEIAKKIGTGVPIGMKFHNRRPTGEIVPINAPGRDPIVTRILWLKGLERQNAKAYDRTIYIHGTAEEWKIGQPASFGCIRMRSADVVNLYRTVGVGAEVDISTGPLPPSPAALQAQAKVSGSPTPAPAL